jgi:hypothetical protein
MAGIVNGIHVVFGEANAVVALLRKFRRNLIQLPALDEHGFTKMYMQYLSNEFLDPLLRNFADLYGVLNSV